MRLVKHFFEFVFLSWILKDFFEGLFHCLIVKMKEYASTLLGVLSDGLVDVEHGLLQGGVDIRITQQAAESSSTNSLRWHAVVLVVGRCVFGPVVAFLREE